MKKLIIATFIFGILLFTACSKEEAVAEKDKESLAQTQSPINYEEVFESVSSSGTDSVQIKRIQSEGIVVEALNNQQLLLKNDSDLLLYNLKTNKETELLQDVYNAVLSTDKNAMAYEKNQKIYLMNLKDRKSVLLYELEGEVSRNFILSSNGDQLLLQTVKEGQYNNKIISINGQVKQIDIEKRDDLVLTDFVHFSGDKLFSLAKVKKENQLSIEDETSSTTDLIMINLKGNNIVNITNLKAEGVADCLDLYGKNQLLVELTESTINDEELLTTHTIKRIDMNSGRMYNTGIKIKDPHSLNILEDEREYIWLEESAEKDENYSQKQDLKIRKKNGEVQTLLSIFNDIPSTLFVQDNRIFFNSNGDIYIVDL